MLRPEALQQIFMKPSSNLEGLTGSRERRRGRQGLGQEAWSLSHGGRMLLD